MAVPDISEAQILQGIVRCGEAMETIDAQRRALDAQSQELGVKRDAVAQKKELLEALLNMQGVEVVEEMAQLPGMPPPEPIKLGARTSGKPDVQVIEEILEMHGPLHIADVVRLGRERGIPFIGKRKPEQVARGKLGASKRFELLGNNVWALPHQVGDGFNRLPHLNVNTPKASNGHGRLSIMP